MSNLEDIKPKPVTINIDEQELLLHFDYEAVSILEDKTDKGIFYIQQLVFENKLKMTDFIELFAAGLNKHHDEKTIQDVKYKLKNHQYLVNKYSANVLEAFMKAFVPPESYEAKAENPENDEKKPQGA
jgi:hypothetical protein